MIRAVIDTNVFVSGLRKPHGNEALLIKAVRTNAICPCVSPDIIAEYHDVLNRPKFRYSDVIVTELLSLIQANGELHHPGAGPHEGPDPGDFMFMACAVTARADYLVTGNRRHFPNQFYASARVVNARDLLERIASAA